MTRIDSPLSLNRSYVLPAFSMLKRSGNLKELLAVGKSWCCLQVYRVQALACMFAQAQPEGCTLYACSHGDHSFFRQTPSGLRRPDWDFNTQGSRGGNPGLEVSTPFGVAAFVAPVLTVLKERGKPAFLTASRSC